MEPIHLGAFELHSPIRKGGMGEVWRGIHQGQEIPVAIKIMTGRRARNPKYLQAFRNEVQAVAALDHPGIVLILDHGKVSLEAQSQSNGRFLAGSPFLVMEMASRGSLDQLKRQMPWYELKAVLITLLDALAHAHARGVIHRDLKPANVLLCSVADPRPGLKLTDFGLAALRQAEDKRQGITENMAGTPRYMAPEVFDGRWRDYGPWTDLYALGCMVYELVTRRPLFSGKTSGDLRRQHQYEKPRVLRSRSTLPDGFASWLLRLVAKRPEDRYRTAADAAWGLLGLGEPENPELSSAHAVVGSLEQSTTVFSVLTGMDSSSMSLSGMDVTHIEDITEVAQTHIWPQQGLADAATFMMPDEADIHDAPTYMIPSVEGIAAADTFLFMSDNEWLRTPVRNRPRDAPETLDEDIDEDNGETQALEIRRPPMPHTWHRTTPPAPSMRLVGAGLSLFDLKPPALVGRMEQREKMWNALSQVHATGTARLVILEGQAGVGKSRLAEWICQRAVEVGAATALRASHSPIPGPGDGLPRMVSRNLRCTGLSRAEARRRVRRQLQLQGVTNDYEWDALTEMITAMTDRQRAARAKVIRFTSPTERYVLVRRHLERLCQERPVVVWLDDVQWGADALWFAQYLLKNQQRHPCPVLLLMTVAGEHLQGRAMESHVLEQLHAMEGTSKLQLGPLGDKEHAELVKELLVLEGGLAEKVQESTGGNPLFVIQLVGSWIRRGVLDVGEQGFVLRPGAEAEAPSGVLEIWHEHIEQLLQEVEGLQEQPLEVLELAAVLGMDVDATEWRQAARRAGVELTVNFLQALVHSALVQPNEGYISFVHAMGRQALEDSAREAGRWETHNRNCAAMLQERYAPDHPGIAERLGRHLVEASDMQIALAPLLTGATARYHSGEYRHAIDLLDRREWAMLNLSSSNHLPHWGEGWLLRAQIYRIMGRYEEAYEWAIYAHEGAGRYKWMKLRGPAMAEVAHLASFTGRATEAGAVGRQVEQFARDQRLPAVLAQACFVQGQGRYLRGMLREACRLTRQALVTYERVGDSLGVARCLRALWAMVLDRGELRLAGDLLNRARELYDQNGHQVGITSCLQAQGQMAVLRGRLAEGADLLQRALSFYEGLGVRHGTAACLGGLARVAQARQDFQAAQQWWQRAIDIQDETGSIRVMDARCHLGLVQLAAGQHEDGARTLSACLEPAQEADRRALQGRIHLGLTLACAGTGEWERWDEHINDAARRLEQTELIDPHLAVAANNAAELALAAGHRQRAMEAYAVALRQWQALKQTQRVQHLQGVIRSIGADD